MTKQSKFCARIALGALALALPQYVWAADAEDQAKPEAILVSATRATEPQTDGTYTGSATILSADDLRHRQTRGVSDALRDVPGVAVSQVAGQTQLRLRGSEGNHVLVLVDGIEVSDPFAGEFDFGTLQAGIGGRVEVLRGPQSALYGSDAIGGVVSYFTPSACDGDPAAGFVEAGSHATLNGAVQAGLCRDDYDVSFGANYFTTDGEPNARDGVRDIARDALTLSAKGSADITPTLTFRAVARYSAVDGDYNDQDFDSASPTFGLLIDSPGVRYEGEALYALVGLKWLASDNWTHDLSAQATDISRDNYASYGRTFGSEGQRIKGSYATTLKLVSTGEVLHQLTFAADAERERYRNTDPFGVAFTGWRSTDNVGLVGEYRLSADRFDLSGALRRDINNRFADATTFRISGGVDAGHGTRLRGAWGSGIKNPGFYELYGYFNGQFIGNPDLRPEKSKGWEVGVDQSLAGDAIRLSATWFDSRLTGEIHTIYPAPTFVATPANRTTRSTRKGLELSARAQLGPQVTLDAAYTWLNAEEAGVEEVRRPGNTASAALTWAAQGDAASATLVVRYNGATDDLAFTDPSFIPVIARLDDYTLVNLNAEVKLAPGLSAFGRVENLLDEEYEQVFSYVSPGRTAIAGLRAQF